MADPEYFGRATTGICNQVVVGCQCAMLAQDWWELQPVWAVKKAKTHSATVNHQVGGSSPSRGAINFPSNSVGYRRLLTAALLYSPHVITMIGHE